MKKVFGGAPRTVTMWYTNPIDLNAQFGALEPDPWVLMPSALQR